MPKSKPAYQINWVTDHLAVGQAPMSVAQLDSLREQGVDAIINLCGEFCDLHDIEAEHGFEVYYLPLPDEEAPELAELEKALEWLDESIYLGKRVLIHCRHGIGRTGTILNAYLLRRGLGHRMAGRKLKGLRSKPANFDQWWTIRKYGRQSGRLTVREPSLEFKHLVDLAPYFLDYEALVQRAEDLFEYESENKGNGSDQTGRCGRDHDRCCSTPVRLSLLEAVYVAQRINGQLSSRERLEAIERAVAVARKERAELLLHEGLDVCLAGAGALCPLSVAGNCMIFPYRPLQCRSFELSEDVKQELWADLLAPALDKGSRDLFFAFTSEFPEETSLVFALPDVVSGRYVQTFFHYMLKRSKAE
ncbi:MAG: dual specificity protein phosphatase family protein [Desulfovibrionaceae bacterium]